MEDNKTIIETYQIPLYKGDLHVLFTTIKEPPALQSYFKEAPENINIKYAHCVAPPDRDYFIVAFNLTTKHKIHHGILSHEALHAVCFILHDRGLELTESSEESYTYLIEWVTNCIYEVVRNNNIQIEYLNNIL